MVIFTAIILVFMSLLNPVAYFSNEEFWKYLVANISTMNFIHPNLPGVFNGEAVNGSLWTIKIEIGFYIILPLLIYLCLGKRETICGARCLVILLVVYLLSVLYIVLFPLVVEKYHIPSSLANQLPAFMRYFAEGMIIFFYYEKISPILNKLAIVVMWIALKAKPLFVLSKCYDFSYWLYLIHYPIIMVIKEFIC